MRILFLAPQPFYVERGTPIAVRQAVETLCEAGHQVDLVTFLGGEDVAIPGMRHTRIALPKQLGPIPIGFSPQKLLGDLWLGAAMLKMLRGARYDVVHAVEESVFLAIPARLLSRFKLVYDMDSIMSDQIIEKWSWARVLGAPMRAFEGLAVRASDLVLPVCEAIAERARRSTGPERIHLLPDVAQEASPSAGQAEDLRATFGIERPFALYVGNLEPYQGMSLLLRGFARARRRCPLVVIGGREEDIARHRAEAEALGLTDVHFAGPRPLDQLAGYLAQADILCSPRLKGANTPMKVYSYMASGRSILATDLSSHTQVLDASTAMLVERAPAAVGEGLSRLLDDAALRERLGSAAQGRVSESYSHAAFRRRLLAAYATLAQERSGSATEPVLAA